MSSFSSPLLKTHSNSRSLSPGLASTPQVTLTLSPLAAPNTSLAWAAHTGASADTQHEKCVKLESWWNTSFTRERAARPCQALGVQRPSNWLLLIMRRSGGQNLCGERINIRETFDNIWVLVRKVNEDIRGETYIMFMTMKIYNYMASVCPTL